jgi:anti-anti-sigma factor
MSQPTFQCDNVDGHLTIRGECDLSNADEIERWLFAFDGAPIQLDLSGVTFLDSSFLHVLLKVKQRNASMRVVESSAVVSRLLEITGTREHLTGGT